MQMNFYSVRIVDKNCLRYSEIGKERGDKKRRSFEYEKEIYRLLKLFVLIYFWK